MRIFSNFQDYYDGCAFYCAENLVYNRQLDNGKNVNKRKDQGITYESDVELLTSLRKVFKSYFKDEFIYRDILSNSHFVNYRKAIIYIGEKIIPFVKMSVTFNSSTKHEILFNKEDLLESMLRNINPRSISFYKKHVNAFFDIKNHIDCYNKIREVSTDPIIVYNNDFVSVNCPLKDFGLSKIIEPHIVLQELELFINKVNSSELDVNFDNDLKIKNAGFDQNSFKRKE